jgi:hypothetical protein
MQAAIIIGCHAAADRRARGARRSTASSLGLFAVWLGLFGVAVFLVSLQDKLSLTSSTTAVAATHNVLDRS